MAAMVQQHYLTRIYHEPECDWFARLAANPAHYRDIEGTPVDGRHCMKCAAALDRVSNKQSSPYPVTYSDLSPGQQFAIEIAEILAERLHDVAVTLGAEAGLWARAKVAAGVRRAYIRLGSRRTRSDSRTIIDADTVGTEPVPYPVDRFGMATGASAVVTCISPGDMDRADVPVGSRVPTGTRGRPCDHGPSAANARHRQSAHPGSWKCCSPGATRALRT
jgi:hypothetical protein